MHMPASFWKEEKREHEKIPKKKVIKHLKGDIKNYKSEAHEDRELIHDLKKTPKVKKHNLGIKKHKSTIGKAKMSKVMGEYKHHTLHSGSKKGPKVTNPKQAVAIALSESRKAGARIPKKRK